MDLAGRSAVVAGGAGGLGSATVRRLASAGVGVVVLDPDLDRAGALAADLGPHVTAVAGDSNDDDAVGAAIAAAQRLGVFSIAVSATGVVIPSGRLVARDGAVLGKDVLLANLDLHVVAPDGSHVYYLRTSSQDDTARFAPHDECISFDCQGDEQNPSETIYWVRAEMKPGSYEAWVENASDRTGSFEIEIDGAALHPQAIERVLRLVELREQLGVLLGDLREELDKVERPGPDLPNV